MNENWNEIREEVVDNYENWIRDNPKEELKDEEFRDSHDYIVRYVKLLKKTESEANFKKALLCLKNETSDWVGQGVELFNINWYKQQFRRCWRCGLPKKVRRSARGFSCKPGCNHYTTGEENELEMKIGRIRRHWYKIPANTRRKIAKAEEDGALWPWRVRYLRWLKEIPRKAESWNEKKVRVAKEAEEKREREKAEKKREQEELDKIAQEMAEEAKVRAEEAKKMNMEIEAIVDGDFDAVDLAKRINDEWWRDPKLGAAMAHPSLRPKVIRALKILSADDSIHRAAKRRFGSWYKRFKS